MNLHTEAFDNYISSWELRMAELGQNAICWKQVGQYVREEDELFGWKDLKAAYKFFTNEASWFDQNYDQTFLSARLEVQKNMASMERITQVDAYHNYIFKRFTDLLNNGMTRIVFNFSGEREGKGNKNDYTRKPATPFTNWDEVEQHLYLTIDKNTDVLIREMRFFKDEFNTEYKLRGTKDETSSEYDSYDLTAPKLKWKGTPAQLAFIIYLLIQKGYLDPISTYGERSAGIVLSHFEISDHQPSKDSMGKLFQDLKKDLLPINKEDASKFQRIPHRTELKK